jgi:hypothetical protein
MVQMDFALSESGLARQDAGQLLTFNVSHVAFRLLLGCTFIRAESRSGQRRSQRPLFRRLRLPQQAQITRRAKAAGRIVRLVVNGPRTGGDSCTRFVSASCRLDIGYQGPFRPLCLRPRKFRFPATEIGVGGDWVRNRVSAREDRASRAAGTIPVADR